MRSNDNPESKGQQRSSPSPQEGFERIDEILARVWPGIVAGLDLPSGRRPRTVPRRLPWRQIPQLASSQAPRTPLDSEKA